MDVINNDIRTLLKNRQMDSLDNSVPPLGDKQIPEPKGGC